MVRALLSVAIGLCALAAAGCGGASSSDWVASGVVVVDERASCVDVSERHGDGRLAVCRDNHGVVTCRQAVADSPPAGSACEAAIDAVRAWETGGSDRS